MQPEWAFRPIALPPNRVSRFYRGGALLDRFRGTPEASDSDQPEDWVGSTTRAWTAPGSEPTLEGLSPLADGRLLTELLDESPTALVGAGLVGAAGATTGLLVKLLDSAVRLPVHCHPSRSFARRVLGRVWGKTEAWLIVETRPIAGESPPHIRLGFRRDVPPAELRGWIEGEQGAPLLEAMHRRPVKAGDAWLVPAGVPHAIGAGVFLVELQEPSDLSVVAETGGFPIDPADASLGRGWDVMIDCFDRRGWTDTALDGLRSRPMLAATDGAVREERLLGAAAESFFRATRLTVHGSGPVPYRDTFAVIVVVGGQGEVGGPGGALPIGRGDTFAVAAASIGDSVVTASSAEPLSLIVCRPPDPRLMPGLAAGA